MGLHHECETSCKTHNQMEFGHGAVCSSATPVSADPQAAKDDKTIDPDCGFTQKAGEKCSILIKEGAQLCDKSCTKLVSSSISLPYSQGGADRP